MLSTLATTFALVSFVKGDNTCNYADFSSNPDAEQNYIDFCSTVTHGPLTACDAEHQDALEKAIATDLYSKSTSTAQCNCVYYDESLAFYYVKSKKCFQTRQATDGARCWDTQYKLFFVDGELEAALNQICSSLPPPTTAAPVTDAPATDAPSNCQDDPDGVLAAIPLSCQMVIGLSGGKCSNPLNPFFAKLKGLKSKSVANLCPGSCNAECQPESDDGEDTLVCQNDPNGVLAGFGTDCWFLLRNIAGGCDDTNGELAMAVPGESAASLCPLSCDARCQ